MYSKLKSLMKALGSLSILALVPVAQADDDYRLRIDKLPAYQQECSACHLAYPPALLPAQSWKRIMSNLGNHYGIDASLDDATVNQISIWLLSNAGGHKAARSAPDQDRITESAWFKRKHDEIDTQIWLRPKIKSPANCAACHTQADRGDFEDDNVRIPR